MERRSRNPDNSAVIHGMSTDTVMRFERMKDSATGVGSRRARDPWGWADADASDPWPGTAIKYNEYAWPPPPQAGA